MLGIFIFNVCIINFFIFIIYNGRNNCSSCSGGISATGSAPECYGSILRILRLPVPTLAATPFAIRELGVLLLLRGEVLTSCGITTWLLLLFSPAFAPLPLLGEAEAPFCRRRLRTNLRVVVPVITVGLVVVVVVVTVCADAFEACACCSSSTVGSTSISVGVLSSCCHIRM